MAEREEEASVQADWAINAQATTAAPMYRSLMISESGRGASTSTGTGNAPFVADPRHLAIDFVRSPRTTEDAHLAAVHRLLSQSRAMTTASTSTRLTPIWPSLSASAASRQMLCSSTHAVASFEMSPALVATVNSRDLLSLYHDLSQATMDPFARSMQLGQLCTNSLSGNGNGASMCRLARNIAIQPMTVMPIEPTTTVRLHQARPQLDCEATRTNRCSSEGQTRIHTVQSPVLMACLVDRLVMSEHQVYLRLQIELFAATEADAASAVRGRNKPIAPGQVGLQCRHCAHLPMARRQTGAVYFPSSTIGLYQAAQNMSTVHIHCGACRYMPDAIKQRFVDLIPSKKAASNVGRKHWAESAKQQCGVVDTEQGMFFR